ncbi:MAG: glycosyltransferase family 87 protein [Flavobacteriales bacterium]|nr:MAG: glycosyltransferase family 87 protein [Flavobacteriales bacterium]
MSRHLLLNLILGAALLFSLAIDFSLTRKYGGVDLRDKVVGARSLIAGRSMYFSPWRPGEPERFADPMVPPGATMTRYTGTPFQSLVMAPLGALPFGAARLPWLVLQYALLLLTVVLARSAFAGTGWPGALVAGIVLVALLASTSWRLHVERGQVYVIFAALIAGLFWSLAKARHLLTGALAAALVLFKPTYAFLLLPLVLRVNARMLIGAVAMVGASAAVFAIIPNGLLAWSEYLEAMRIWSTMPGLGAPPSTDPGAFAYPSLIEGLANLREHHAMEFENGSIAAVLLAVVGLSLSGWLPWVAYGTVLLTGLLLLRRNAARASAEHLLLLGFIAWTVLMMLLPTPRFDYQLVHWVAPALLVVLGGQRRPFMLDAMLLVAAGLVVGAWSILPVDILLAEGLLLVVCAWVLVASGRQVAPKAAS